MLAITVIWDLPAHCLGSSFSLSYGVKWKRVRPPPVRSREITLNSVCFAQVLVPATLSVFCFTLGARVWPLLVETPFYGIRDALLLACISHLLGVWSLRSTGPSPTTAISFGTSSRCCGKKHGCDSVWAIGLNCVG